MGNTLFESVTPVPIGYSYEAYNEALVAENQLREHWFSVIKEMTETDGEVMKRMQRRLTRMRREDGATFNPFDDPVERTTMWSPDIIPMVITAKEWEIIEKGLVQRAVLLEKILADVYGPQNLMKENLIPAEMIYANPGFLRPCHNIVPVDNRYLTFYAADIYRDINGNFRVWHDYTASPAGLGYVLENRIVLSRVFTGRYQDSRLRRLAPFFNSFHQDLQKRSAAREEDPGIVILAPGPESRIYFEHALLSRYLNYPLVEGQDLTVRDGEVFLKKLTGLEPVSVILRHIDDQESDPFTLRRSGTSGVAGLIQAAREKNIILSNPIGSGFAETPALASLLPELCMHMLGEPLQLDNHPLWWCIDSNAREHVLASINQLTLYNAMQRESYIPADDFLVNAIQEKPYAYMASEPIKPSIVPSWTHDGFCSHYTVMRIFLCAVENGFEVMPGGLSITSDDIETLQSNNPEKQQSKDILVLSDEPVAPFSLMGTLQNPAPLRRSNDLPSRVVDQLLWLGRYLERAEGRVRLLRSVLRRLSGEERLQDLTELPFLLSLLRAQDSIPKVDEKSPEIPEYTKLMRQLSDALYAKSPVESVAVVLNQVEETAWSVRDWFSMDSWHVINKLEEFVEDIEEDPIELLDEILLALSAFSGLAMESMTRGFGWRFMDMGRRVERAINHTAMIRIGLNRILTESQNTMEAMLDVAASIMTYRWRYRTTFQPAPVLDLLLVDESNPKSLAFQCSQLAHHMEALPRENERRYSTTEEKLALEMVTEIRLLDLTGFALNKETADVETLTAFLQTMETRLKKFASEISAHYLSRVPSTPHYSIISGQRP